MLNIFIQNLKRSSELKQAPRQRHVEVRCGAVFGAVGVGDTQGRAFLGLGGLSIQAYGTRSKFWFPMPQTLTHTHLGSQIDAHQPPA